MSAERIRQLNDAFRTDLFSGERGRVLVTTAVDQLSKLLRALLLEQVRTFTHFNQHNDPHGEHDFGTIEFLGQKWFWKIDYFDLSMHFGSPDPADPARTTRVLTVMREDEY